METQVFKVEGMGCGGCANRVRNALCFMDGVSDVDVNLETGDVEVKYDRDKTSASLMIKSIKQVGYSAM